MTSTTTDDITTIPELLAALQTRIPRSRIGRGEDLLTEIRDGLDDAASAYRSAGLSPTAAEHRAVTDFGIAEIDQIAQQCQAELGTVATVRAAVVTSLGYVAIIASWALYGRLFDTVTRFQDGGRASIGFVIVAASSVLMSLATVAALRFQARAANRSDRTTRRGGRPIRRLTSRVFAVLALDSILATYVLAWLSHRPSLGWSAGGIAGLVAEGLSATLTLIMAAAIIHSVRRMGITDRTS